MYYPLSASNNNGEPVSASKVNRTNPFPPVIVPSRAVSTSNSQYRGRKKEVFPTSLRFDGGQKRNQIYPIELLRSGVMDTCESWELARSLQPSCRFRVPSDTSSMKMYSERSHIHLHPLLLQILLLIEVTEVEGRLALIQIQLREFDDILALFTIAKEVEAVRVAAFELFRIEKESRYALLSQEKRSRLLLMGLLIATGEDTLQYVNLQAHLNTEEPMSHLNTSLLKYRSVSLPDLSRELFSSSIDLQKVPGEKKSCSAVSKATELKIAPRSPQGASLKGGEKFVSLSLQVEPFLPRAVATDMSPELIPMGTSSPSHHLGRDRIHVDLSCSCPSSTALSCTRSLEEMESSLLERIERQSRLLFAFS